MGDRIVIVKKKKGHGHGHHGGSWKVAYADFVTAMMAFFLVMWIMGMDQGTRNMVQGYFQNPVGFRRDYFSGGSNPMMIGSAVVNLEFQNALIYRRQEDERRLRQAAQEIEDQLAALGILEEANADVEIVVTDEGLRIELMETGAQDALFASGSALLQPALRDVLAAVAAQIADLPNGVIIEGHTDAAPFGRPDYTNWELSADRANAARRVLLETGMPLESLNEVRSLADRKLKYPDQPLDARNRRITLLLPYNTPDPTEAEQAIADAAAGSTEGESGGGGSP